MLRVVNPGESYQAEACRRCSGAPQKAMHLGYCGECWDGLARVIGPGIYPPALIHEMCDLYFPMPAPQAKEGEG